MNILRPPHLSRVFKRFSIAFIFLGVLSGLLYLLCLKLGLIHSFWVLLSKVAFSLTINSMNSLLIKVGCSGGLAKAIDFAVKAFFTEPHFMVSPGESPVGSIGSIGSGSWIEKSYPSTHRPDGVEVQSAPTPVQGPPAAALPPVAEAGPPHQPHGSPEGGVPLEAPALNQPDEGDGIRASREQRQLIRAVDRSQREEAIFIEAARRLLLEKEIPVEDPADVKRVASLYLEGKTTQQVSRATRALGNPNSKTVADFLAVL